MITTLDKKTKDLYDKVVSWKIHNDMEYLHVNFHNLSDDEIILVAKRIRHELEIKPDKSVRWFLDASSFDINIRTNFVLRKVASQVQHIILKSVFIGVSGYKVFLFEAYQKFTGSTARLFDNEEDGLNYLCS